MEAPEELVIVGDPTAIGARSLGDMAAAVLILSAITIAGGYLPARRAANVDPMVALRYE